MSEVRPAHQVEERGQQGIEQEIAKREAVCKQDVQLIAGRFNTLMRQCCDLRDASATPAVGYPKGCRANAAAMRSHYGCSGTL